MKKEMILVIGLLSLFATVSLISVIRSWPREPEIEYVQVEKTVEVEKPVEVIKEVPVETTVYVDKEVVVEKEVEVPAEVEKTVYVDRPIEKVVEKEVKVEVPVEKIVEVEKTVYVEKSQVDLNGIEVVKLDDNLYEFEFTATQCINDPSQIKKIFELNDLRFYNSAFQCGELISKPGYIIKDILFANPDQMAAPTVLDNDYNKILSASSNFYSIKYEYSNLNKEQIHISFNTYSNYYNASFNTYSNYYSAKVLRIVFAINNETYTRPTVDQAIYGYAGLQVNNSDCIYKRGYIGETVTSEELENFVLSLYPNCKITAKNYSTFTATYTTQQFTTRKIWIERIS